MNYMKADTNTALVVVDALLALVVEDDDEAMQLESVLHDGHSAWRVHRDGATWGLVRRLDPTLEATAGQVRERGGTASELLGRAWTRAFGLDQDASDAYRHAIRAVEAVWRDLALPNNDKATLGTVLAHLRDASDKWEGVLHGDGDADPVGTVVGMMQMLWKHQYDRHVTPDKPLHVEPAEAEAAVAIATILVRLGQTDAIRRK